MGVLAVNKDTCEIRYYYGSEYFEIPQDIESGQIFTFNKPPLKREFCIRNGKAIELMMSIPSVFSSDDIDNKFDSTTTCGQDAIYYMDK